MTQSGKTSRPVANEAASVPIIEIHYHKNTGYFLFAGMYCF